MGRSGVQPSRAGFFLDDLEVGQEAETSRQVTQADIAAFAAVSGDDNPLHLDRAYAETTPFKGPIAHGMLSAAYISAVLGTKLPGPGAVYVTQSLRFRRPVRAGDQVTTRVTVEAVDEAKALVTLKTVVLVNGKTAVDGEAVVTAPRRPTEAS